MGDSNDDGAGDDGYGQIINTIDNMNAYVKWRDCEYLEPNVNMCWDGQDERVRKDGAKFWWPVREGGARCWHLRARWVKAGRPRHDGGDNATAAHDLKACRRHGGCCNRVRLLTHTLRESEH